MFLWPSNKPCSAWMSLIGTCTGFPDPVLARSLGPAAAQAQVSLAFAWSSKDAPLAALGGSSLRDLSYKRSPLISDLSMQTGKRKNETANKVAPPAFLMQWDMLMLSCSGSLLAPTVVHCCG